jgi:GTP-binding protein EngB required for normal cell division
VSHRVGLDASNAGLEELLRRCHKKELAHLAAALQVEPRRGLRDLAAAIARKLRWAGTHKFWALYAIPWRGLVPDDYHEVLAGLAKRLKVQTGQTLEQTEQAILSRYMAESWTHLDDEARLRLWQERGLRPPVPGLGHQAILRAREAFGDKASFYFATLILPALPALPFAVVGLPGMFPLLLWWLYRPNDKVLAPAVLEVARLRQLVLHRVTVGVVGSPSSGKDAAIRALFGIDHGNVDPVAGSTKEVQITRLPGSTATWIINTPGLGDVVESVTEEARQILDHIDVYLYVVNAQGGVQARERADYSACLKSGRPVLAVVNKIDTLRESDRARYLDDARKKLGAPEDAFVAAAFDPLPQLSAGPIGLQAVRAWLLHRLLAAGKDPAELGFAKEPPLET